MNFNQVPGVEYNAGKFGLINIKCESNLHPETNRPFQVGGHQSIQDFMRAAYSTERNAEVVMLEKGCKIRKMSKEWITVIPQPPTTKDTPERQKAEQEYWDSFSSQNNKVGVQEKIPV